MVAIAKNGPAHQAGIRPGDIITHMNGNMIEDPRAAMEMISNMKPGAKVTIRVNRQNQPLDILVVVSARPTPHS